MNVKEWLRDTSIKTNDDTDFNNELMRFFYFASLESKKLNDEGKMPIITANTIDVIYQGPIKFNNIAPASNNYRLETIKSLTNLMVGINLGNVDYAFSDKWISDNYKTYKPFLPSIDERYYDAIINGDEPIYYCDFKSNPKIIPQKSEDNMSGFNPQVTKVKATQAGKIYGETDVNQMEHKTGFINVALISSVILLIILIILAIYFYFIH